MKFTQILEFLNNKNTKWAIWDTKQDKGGMLSKGDKILFGPFDNEAEATAKVKQLWAKDGSDKWSGKTYIGQWSRRK